MPREAVICDIRDRHTLRGVFGRFRPDVVFHAAAHKHVPLLEANPSEAVWNNVGGTRNVAELAAEFRVDRLVNVSTDKAVNPTNLLGASKRVGEMVVSTVAEACEATTMLSVRFGNVLGSRGSVVPLFREQIERGGPVTVTHPDRVRYFMTIPEAAQLVLQAGAIAENGRVCVLDMGAPVRIADLAHDLVLLSGFRPGTDIEIRYSGTRPGEKLFEELLTTAEGTDASSHEKIFVARKQDAPPDVQARLDALLDAAHAGTREGIQAAFQRLVPSYRPDAAAPTGSGRERPAGTASTGEAFLVTPQPGALPALGQEAWRPTRTATLRCALALPVDLFVVDAFARRPFEGNPAAVVPLDAPAEPAWMQAVAAEMNLSETAFLHPAADGAWALRWFTPTVEVDLCGHATLAAAYVLFETDRLAPGDAARFDTRSGRLTVRRADDGLAMDFPATPPSEAPAPDGLADVLGATPVWTGRSRFDAFAVVPSPDAVRNLIPDHAAIAALGTRGLIVTARAEPGAAYDVVSRFFAPGAGVAEDPVTGSAHCAIGPYWAGVLGQDRLVCYQASARGGTVGVVVRGDRVTLAGPAVTVVRGTLAAAPPAVSPPVAP